MTGRHLPDWVAFLLRNMQHNGKLLRAVLRGEGGRKASDLPGGRICYKHSSKNAHD